MFHIIVKVPGAPVDFSLIYICLVIAQLFSCTNPVFRVLLPCTLLFPELKFFNRLIRERLSWALAAYTSRATTLVAATETSISGGVATVSCLLPFQLQHKPPQQPLSGAVLGRSRSSTQDSLPSSCVLAQTKRTCYHSPQEMCLILLMWRGLGRSKSSTQRPLDDCRLTSFFMRVSSDKEDMLS